MPGAPVAGSTPGLWRHRGFLLLWSGQTLSQFGAQFSGLALPVLAVLLLGADEWQLGLLTSVETAAFLVVGLPAGAWIDRLRKRRVMIAADLVRALALAVLPVAFLTGTLEIGHLFAVGAVLGVATVFFDVSYQSYIPILVRPAQVADANGKLEATAQVAGIAGPAAAGVLLTVATAPFVLIGTCLTYLASSAALLVIRDEEKPADPATRMPLHREIAEGLRFVIGHDLIRRITATTGVSNFFSIIVFTMFPLLVLRELGFAPATLGLILSVASAGGLLGAVSTPWISRRVGEGSSIPLSAALTGVSMLALPLAGTIESLALPLLVVGQFGVSFTVVVYNIAQVTFRQRVCPPRLLGRMNASIRCIVWGVMPLGAVAAGALGTGLGVVPTMWIGAVGTLLAIVFTVFSPLRGMRTLPPR